MTDDKITQLTICNKDGLTKVSGKVIIDASGDGDVAAWAGADMTKGRPEDGAAQPMTMKMKFCNVDTAKLKAYVLDHLEDFPRLCKHEDLIRRNEPFALAGFAEAFKKAKAKKQP